jgi:nitroreductase
MMAMIRKILHYPKSVFQHFIAVKLPRLVVSSKRLSLLYYFLFDRSFDREVRAVLAGKIVHLEEAKKNKANYFLLIRNIHRIEKGLLMRPRKEIFGKDYIAETIDNYAGVYKLNGNEKKNLQLKWFFDVLAEYFKTVNGSDPLISKEKVRFEKTTFQSALAHSTHKSIPYFRTAGDKSTITYDQFYLLSKQRRSVRWFLDQPVPRSLIDNAVLAANQAPSACNRQPFEFRIFDDPDLVKQVVTFPMGTRGYEHSIPVMMVIVGNLDAYFSERDRHIIYIDASLAAMTMMLALETMGLSSCSLNWPDVEDRERKMEKFLKLALHQRPIMCMGIGYPDPEGQVAYSEKRPLNQIRKYN